MAAVLDDTPSHLRGNGRPVSEEQTLVDLAVKGAIPEGLDGRYLRNGANPFTGTSPHPFFGDGMIHGIRLRHGKAEWYRNRYVQTPFIKGEVGEGLDLNVLTDMTCSKANTHVVGHGGKFWRSRKATFHSF